MSRPLLIAGLDPGTTFAYALLDLDGTPVAVSSAKEHSQESIVRDITHHGRILILGSDKKQTPDTVAKIGAQTGARLMEPDNDISVEEKRRLTRAEKPENSHERDALAAAYTHLKAISPTVRKIRRFVEREGLDDIADEIVLLVIRHDINVRHAWDLLDKERYPGASKERELALDAVQMPQRREKNILKLYDRIKEFSLRTSYLERELEKEKAKKKDTEKKDTKKAPPSIDSYEQKLAFKDKKIKRLQRERQKDTRKRKRLQSEITSLTGMLEQAAKGMLVTRIIPDLSNRNVKKIAKGEVICVEDTSVIANSAIQELRKRSVVILYRGRLSRPLKQEPAIRCIPLKEVKILHEHASFRVINPSSLKKAGYSHDMIERIVEEHRGSHS